MVTVQKRLQRPILHVLGNVVLAQVGINADPVRSSAREEKSSRGVEHGIHKDACVVGPTSPRRRVASQTSQHGEKCVHINSVDRKSVVEEKSVDLVGGGS